MNGLPQSVQRHHGNSIRGGSKMGANGGLASVRWIPPPGLQRFQQISKDGDYNALASILYLNNGPRAETTTVSSGKQCVNDPRVPTGCTRSVIHQYGKANGVNVSPRARDRVMGVCGSGHGSVNSAPQKKGAYSILSAPSVDRLPLPLVRHDKTANERSSAKDEVYVHMLKRHSSIDDSRVLPEMVSRNGYHAKKVTSAPPTSDFESKKKLRRHASSEFDRPFTSAPSGRGGRMENIASTRGYIPKERLPHLNEGQCETLLPSAVRTDALDTMIEPGPTSSDATTRGPSLVISGDIPGMVVRYHTKNGEEGSLLSQPSNTMHIRTTTITRVTKKTKYLPLGADFDQGVGEEELPVNCSPESSSKDGDNHKTSFLNVNNGAVTTMNGNQSKNNKIYHCNNINSSERNNNGCNSSHLRVPLRQSPSTLPGFKGHGSTASSEKPDGSLLPHLSTFQHSGCSNERSMMDVLGSHLWARRNQESDHILAPPDACPKEVESSSKLETHMRGGHTYVLQKHRQMVDVGHQRCVAKSCDAEGAQSKVAESPPGYWDKTSGRGEEVQGNRLRMAHNMRPELSRDDGDSGFPCTGGVSLPDMGRESVSSSRRSSSMWSNLSYDTVKQAITVDKANDTLKDKGLGKEPNKKNVRCIIVSDGEWDGDMEDEEDEYIAGEGGFCGLCPASPTLTIPARHERPTKFLIDDEADGTESSTSTKI